MQAVAKDMQDTAFAEHYSTGNIVQSNPAAVIGMDILQHNLELSVCACAGCRRRRTLLDWKMSVQNVPQLHKALYCLKFVGLFRFLQGEYREQSIKEFFLSGNVGKKDQTVQR